jgi:hypothetical protein
MPWIIASPSPHICTPAAALRSHLERILLTYLAPCEPAIHGSPLACAAQPVLLAATDRPCCLASARAYFIRCCDTRPVSRAQLRRTWRGPGAQLQRRWAQLHGEHRPLQSRAALPGQPPCPSCPLPGSAAAQLLQSAHTQRAQVHQDLSHVTTGRQLVIEAYIVDKERIQKWKTVHEHHCTDKGLPV